LKNKTFLIVASVLGLVRKEKNKNTVPEKIHLKNKSFTLGLQSVRE
jgi:hypothetical protein